MFLGIDLGTSAVKLVVIDEGQVPVATATAGIKALPVRPPFSEQDPHGWVAAIESALSLLREQEFSLFAAIRGIGLSGHMHGAVTLDADDRVLRPCIMWDDGRSSEECAELSRLADFEGIGGNLVMAGFTAPKLRWMEKHEPDRFARIARVLLPKDYIRLWLTGEHVAEMSDAAGTLWLDVAQRRWSKKLLAATNLQESQMPRLCEGTDISGTLRPCLAEEWGFRPGTVVAGGAGDNAAAACGMGIVEDGAFVSLGTSGVVFAPTSAFLPNTTQGVHSFCHAVPGTWHQMGVILAASSCLDWLAQMFGKEVTEMLALLPAVQEGPSDVRFLPYLTGVRTPHNDPLALASFHGLSNKSGPGDLVLSVLEGVGFALKDCFDALAGGGNAVQEAYAIGGGSRSQPWLQIIADICDVTLLIPEDGEYGAAFGAACLAMSAVGGSYDPEIFSRPEICRRAVPDAGRRDAYREGHHGWKALYRR